MFSNYSWSEFFVSIGLMLFLYFIIIGYAYYKNDITHFLFANRNRLHEAMESPAIKTDLVPIVHELVGELGVIIRQASGNNPAIPELLFALKQCIKDFLILDPSAYKSKINLYIAEELEIRGIHGIGIEEIENLWKA